MANEVAEKPKFNPALAQYSNSFVDLISRKFVDNEMTFDPYSKQCVMASMQSIYTLVTESNENMANIDRSNIEDILTTVSMLKLNANSHPRECFFQLRSKKIGGKWVKKVELGVEGDGNDAILRNFGENVKTVHPYWLVRENDLFEYPKHVGLELTPPSWSQVEDGGKIDKVVYPIETTDGKVNYWIAERNGVINNLIAHIRNNMMNETFGICAKKYDATAKQKLDIDAKKIAIMDIAKNFETVDEIVDCKELQPYMSMAWTDSREAMIERKMRNNAIRKFPKDLGSKVAMTAYVKTDDGYKTIVDEIEDGENAEDFEEAIKDAECKQIEE